MAPAAARGPPAPHAGQPRQVAAERDLEQHGSVRGQRGPRRGKGGRRQPRVVRGATGTRRVLVAAGPDQRRPRPHRRPRGDDLLRPAGVQQQLRLGGPGEATDQQRARPAGGPQHQHVPGVRVRRARLVQQVVAVVEDGDQTEVGDRGEHRAPGAGHHPDVAAQRGQEAPVPLRRSQLGGQRDEAAGRRGGGQRRFEPAQVTRVRHDEQRAPARPRGRRGGHGEQGGPVLARQRLPHRPRRAPARDRGEERRPGRVVRPAARRRLPGGPGRRVGGRRAGRLRGIHGRRAGRRRPLPLHPRVPWRHREPEHVGQRAGVAVGDRPGQRGDLRREHRLRRHHPLHEAEPTVVVGGGEALEHVAADEPAGEPHPHPRPRPGGGGVGLVHQVVERPVEVSQRRVDGDPGHGPLGRGLAGAGPPCRPPAGAPGRGARPVPAGSEMPHRRGYQTDPSAGPGSPPSFGGPAPERPTARLRAVHRLRRRLHGFRATGRAPRAGAIARNRCGPPAPGAAGGGDEHTALDHASAGASCCRARSSRCRYRPDQMPSSDFRSDERSVDSQGRSTSVRPKWPYAEVWA